MTGLALAGVAYALNSRRDAVRPAAGEQVRRFRDELAPRLDHLQAQYGPTLRKMALAAGFMPGLKFRWRLLAASLPQIMSALQNAAHRPAGLGARRFS